MKRLLVLFIAVFPLTVSAQDTVIEPIPLRPYKWKLGLCYAPEYASRTLRVEENNPIAQQIAAGRNDREHAKFGYTVGADAHYQLHRRIGLSFGLQYSNKGYSNKTAQYGPDPFYPSPNYIASARQVYSYTYIEIPLLVDVTVFQCGKLSIGAAAGLTGSILLSANATSHLTYADGSKKRSRSKDEITDYRTFLFSARVQVAAAYRLSSRSMIQLAPSYRHGLNSIVNAPIRGYLWSYGLNLGYYRSL